MFLDIISLIAFIYIILISGLININSDEYLFNKFVIFASIFVFDFILKILKYAKSNCKVDINQVIANSLYTAFAGMVGIMIYQDLKLMDSTSSFILDNMCYENEYIDAVFPLIFIIGMIIVVKIITSIFTTPDEKECII